MIRIALIYGTIAGAIVIAMMMLTFHLQKADPSFMSHVIGYLKMLIALSLIFFGVKKYRDENHGGVITFGKAFLAGLAIATAAGVSYVVAAEIYHAATDHAFIGKYTAGLIEMKREEGVSGAELDTFIARMDELKTSYANPLFRLPVTFSEIFPVALLVALVSAALLRNEKFLPARK